MKYLVPAMVIIVIFLVCSQAQNAMEFIASQWSATKNLTKLSVITVDLGRDDDCDGRQDKIIREYDPDTGKVTWTWQESNPDDNSIISKTTKVGEPVTGPRDLPRGKFDLFEIATGDSYLPPGFVGNPFPDTQLETNVEGDLTCPIMWTIISGELPPGLTLSDSGVISGTPAQAGTFEFQAQALWQVPPADDCERVQWLSITVCDTGGS